MNANRPVFARIMDFRSQRWFKTVVRRYRGDHKVTRFSCRYRFLCMAFAQLSFRKSLRDIEASLGAQPRRLFHLGIDASPLHHLGRQFAIFSGLSECSEALTQLRERARRP